MEKEGAFNEQWCQHVNDIKHYSLVNELDYASAWIDGHTVFASKGKLYLKPCRKRTVNGNEMTKCEIEALMETPGTPFLVVQALL